ncbi:MAG TPA: recombinase family protein [Ruminococcus flavefaciens]|nr:recombinase family protein [Ruminococcus flavefaciens]
MVELLRGGFSSHTAQQCRAAFYHNLSPDPVEQTVTAELMKHRDKHTADIYGVQLSDVYVDHAYNAEKKRPAFEKMLEDAKNGRFDCIITKSIERFAPISEETIQVIEELLSLPNQVTVIFESDMLDSNVIHSVIPILRGCCI